jgi:hypothetical protein
MKRALIVIASVGILAVTVAMEGANAQVTRPHRAPPPHAEPGSQGAGWNGPGQTTYEGKVIYDSSKPAPNVAPGGGTDFRTPADRAWPR